MKKVAVLACVAVFSASIWANVVVGEAAIPAGYYDEVQGVSSADNILNTLEDIIDGHTVINYGALEPYYAQTDFYGDSVWDIYSTCYFTMADANKQQHAVCDGWNKEHTIPQSWFNSGSPMKSDLFHVYPTDARVNNFRSNLPYGEVAGANGAGFPDNYQGHGLGKKGANTFPGYTGTVFEPADEYKGDLARTYFYMVARYRDKAMNSSGGGVVFTSNKTNLTSFAKNLFLKWHRQDPVSQKEIDRNQAVYGIQHNRNPFIDYPELAEYIWGDRVGQSVDLASMVPTCDGGGYTPGITVKYGVSWSVNGVIIRTDSVISGRAVPGLPETPEAFSEESHVFMGWTDSEIEGSMDEVPSVLYNSVSEIPAITADVTFYAVFARATEGETIEPAVYIFDADHQDGWTNTASNKNNSYWLLDQGKVLISPTINLAGLSSIQVKIRTYGGKQYCNLDVKAGDTQIATIEATGGSSLTDYTWTNTASLTGYQALTFSSNYGEQKGIGLSSVTINATGSGVTYDDYITYESVTGIENQRAIPEAKKVLIQGQMYIMLHDQLYTITGQRVR